MEEELALVADGLSRLVGARLEHAGVERHLVPARADHHARDDQGNPHDGGRGACRRARGDERERQADQRPGHRDGEERRLGAEARDRHEAGEDRADDRADRVDGVEPADHGSGPVAFGGHGTHEDERKDGPGKQRGEEEEGEDRAGVHGDETREAGRPPPLPEVGVPVREAVGGRHGGEQADGHQEGHLSELRPDVGEAPATP